MWGVTRLDNVVYVVLSQVIKMYSADTLSPLGEDIHIKEMRNPNDIVACRDDRQLYVADDDSCVWRVSVDDHSYIKWLPTDSTTDTFHTLSVTSRRLLVTSRSHNLREYSTTSRRLLRVVTLPDYMSELHHSIETTRGAFVVGHQGTLHNELQSAVSQLSTTLFASIHRTIYYLITLFNFARKNNK